nr:hypothetical protein [Angustibacter aerolatus]
MTAADVREARTASSGYSALSLDAPVDDDGGSVVDLVADPGGLDLDDHAAAASIGPLLREPAGARPRAALDAVLRRLHPRRSPRRSA